MDSGKIKMEVNIAGEHIPLTVRFSQQELVRKTEAELRLLHREWSEKMPGRSPKELLAMMAYRYASRYYELLERADSARDEAEEILEEATRMCVADTDADEPAILS